MLKIKVCGMCEQRNIETLMQLDIDYIGFIFYEKSPRYVAYIPDIDSKNIRKTGVFVNAELSVVQQKVAEGLQVVQLHGSESPLLCAEVRKLGVESWKAFGLHPDFSWEILEPYLDSVDYFLFDTSSQQHGGTGQVFDWSILNDYPYDKPYFLSGGISLDNIAQALEIQDTRLVGLDLNSKFEQSPGLKDIEKLKKALKIIKDE